MFVDGNPALNDFLTRLSYGAAFQMRDFLGSQLAQSTRERFASIAGVGERGAAAATLHSEGIVELGPVLDARQVAEAVAALMRAPVHDAHVPTATSPPQAFDALCGRVHYASYAPAAVLAAPHLIELANSPGVLGLVESYLGCPPTLYSVNAWWSFPQARRASYSQALHRDRDDFRFVTLFVYLTTVTAVSGPHRYVRFSHDARQLAGRLVASGVAPDQLQATLDELFAGTGYQHSEQAETLLGDLVHSWVGDAGTAILADTYGLHMGKLPQEGNRLMFWARYGLGANDVSPITADVGNDVDLGARAQ